MDRFRNTQSYFKDGIGLLRTFLGICHLESKLIVLDTSASDAIPEEKYRVEGNCAPVTPLPLIL